MKKSFQILLLISILILCQAVKRENVCLTTFHTIKTKNINELPAKSILDNNSLKQNKKLSIYFENSALIDTLNDEVKNISAMNQFKTDYG